MSTLRQAQGGTLRQALAVLRQPFDKLRVTHFDRLGITAQGGTLYCHPRLDLGSSLEHFIMDSGLHRNDRSKICSINSASNYRFQPLVYLGTSTTLSAQHC